MIAGDMNAHNTTWNCEETDKNGERLQEIMKEKDLYIVNYDTKTRMGDINRRDSNIDLK